jgi:hypothetical protein
MLPDTFHLLMYPALRPTDITLDLGTYGVKHHDWQGTWDDPELTGSVVAAIKLSLVYQNIRTGESAQLVRSHQAAGSGMFEIVLPIETVAGVVDPDMANYIMNPKGLRWIWAEPPVLSAVIRRVATVTVNLKAELR